MAKKLSETELAEALSNLSDWRSDGFQIEKEFRFAAYKDGLFFACAVGYLADAMDHHPDLTIGYQQVKVALSTHSAGGITELDIRLATRIENL